MSTTTGIAPVFLDDPHDSAPHTWIPLTVADLLDDTNTGFLNNPDTQNHLRAARQELSVRNAELANTNPSLHLNLELARQSGYATPLYSATADALHERALTVLSDITPLRGQTRIVAASRLVDELLGLGPIEPFMRDPDVTEIMINSPTVILFEKHGILHQCPNARFQDQGHCESTAHHIALKLGANITPVTPILDGRLPNGDRININHPRVSEHWTITIRRFPDKTWTLHELVQRSAITTPLALALADMVRSRFTMVVVGGTSSGKTSLLNALIAAIAPTGHDAGERLITIEDSRELRAHPDVLNVVHMVTSPGGENAQPVTQRDLVKDALRMRPDRIIGGEVRDAVMYDIIQAVTTGHKGMTTVHAEYPDGAINRIRSLYAEGAPSQLSRTDLNMTLADAVDIIVVVERLPGGKRRVVNVSEVTLTQDLELTTNSLWEYDPHTDTQLPTGRTLSDRLLSQQAKHLTTRTTTTELEHTHQRTQAADRERRAERRANAGWSV